ncbi:hypothetical protein E3J48_07100 [Candidatus Aerophobetes bacterium]|uniref:Uncharacterized protein n=1 Tax=Aerophobetes bacterium TaxID=2030807 RepID=A0A523VZ33_UNCAE|nr:MAG: hypothetical protein E3J48_07100 [Candidatus Aerophobetes bacterium]
MIFSRGIRPVHFVRVFFAVLLLSLCLSLAFAQLSPDGLNTIRIRGRGTVDSKGQLHLELDWRIPTNALYTEIKRNFPNPYVILREFASQRAAFEVANARITYDDAERALHLGGAFLGAGVNKRGRWEIDLGEGVDCLWIKDQTAIFLEIAPIDSDLLQIMDVIIDLPKEASNVKYDENRGMLTYFLPEEPSSGYCRLDLSLRCKPRLTPATYKVYGNPNISNGDMWVAKAIFKNTGASNIRDLKISYKLGEYSDWSIPTTYSLIVPGGCVVDLYYPIISTRVTELSSRTPVDVRVKYEFSDEEGNGYSEMSGERIEILGMNQMEFSNFTLEEMTGTWAEYFSNSPLLAAWVTHLDPPVKALAGMASRLAGGVPTALDPESAVRFCRALYELEVANGVAYQTPSGFLEEYVPGQDIKYPRDVLRDKSGTCVDLGIIYASACEAVGLKTSLVIVPGHCFPVIHLPDGDLLPVECTGISGAAVGAPEVPAISFDQAVEIGIKELSDLKMGLHYVVDVQDMQRKGVVSPQLPRLEGDILQRWGWHLPGELPPAFEEEGAVIPTSGFARYSNEQQKLSFLYPEEWNIQEEEGAIHLVHPEAFARVTMLRIWEDSDPEATLESVEEHLVQEYHDFAVTSRTKVMVNGIDAWRVDGKSTSTEGIDVIHNVLILYESGLARALAVCAMLENQHVALSPIVEQVFDSITLLEH